MRKLLFFGELPPDIIHGVSLSNELNLSILSKIYNVTKINDRSNFLEPNFLFSKIYCFICSLINLYKLTRGHKFDVFYASLPTSVFGVAKLYLFIFFMKILNSNKCYNYLHVHRGDFNIKYKSSFIFKFFVKLLNDKNTTFIALSKKHKLNMLKVVEKVEYIENSIIIDNLELGKPHTFKSGVKFLYLSNYTKDKGILTLLSTFKKITDKNVFLSCYGNFIDKNIEDEVNSFNCLKNITINSSISGQDKENAIRDCDFMILPSLNEGQPLTIIEAMAFGKPIICIDVGFVKEMFFNDYPFVYKYLDEDKLKQVIDDCVHIKSEYYDSISVRLKDRYVYKFSLQSHSKKLHSIFKKSFL